MADGFDHVMKLFLLTCDIGCVEHKVGFENPHTNLASRCCDDGKACSLKTGASEPVAEAVAGRPACEDDVMAGRIGAGVDVNEGVNTVRHNNHLLQKHTRG